MNSLRSRILLTGFVLVFVVLAVSQYGRQLFNEVDANNRLITSEYSQLSHLANAIKTPLLNAESSLYLYMLVLDEEQKNQLKQYFSEVSNQLRGLKQHRLVTKAPVLLKEVNHLTGLIKRLIKAEKRLVNMTAAERYPGMNLISHQLGPNNQRFLGYMQIILQDSEDRIDEGETDQDQRDTYQKLKTLRYNWLRMISATRIFIAARSGLYGAPTPSMKVAKGNVDVYMKVVSDEIRELLSPSVRSRLSEEQIDLLKRIEALMDFRSMATSELTDILMSDDWRHDIPVVLGRINPLFEQARISLTLIDRRLEEKAHTLRFKSQHATHTLSGFLWGFSLLMLCLLVVVYLVFEFMVRRPLLHVVAAMDDIAKGSEKVELASTGIQEIDRVIHAFRLMQDQVNIRQQRIKSILANAGEGIIVINDHGIIESFNAAAEAIFGYHEKAVLGKNVKLLMPHPWRDEHDQYLKKYRQNEGMTSVVTGKAREVIGQRENGQTVILQLTTSSTFIGGERKFIGVLIDMTEKKAEEKLLREAKEKAEVAHTEVIRSMETLRNTQKQLVEAEKMASLGGLVAGVSHEINTPLGVGVTATSHILEELEDLRQSIDGSHLTRQGLDDFYEAAKEAAEILQNNLQRASELVKSFKQVAVDQASAEKREFNLSQYLQEILLNLRPRLKRTQHIIKVDCNKDWVINSYPGAYSQILTNLIINSLIHAYDEGCWGELSIKVTLLKGQLKLVYQDDGKGMPQQVVEHIFEPFFTTRRGEGGSGLGMHIVYNLATQTLGGRVICHSTPSQGTRFEFDFPV